MRACLLMLLDFRVTWKTNDPSEKNLRDAIDKFSSLGVKLQITELDMTIYEGRNDTIGIGFTPEREQKQIDQYIKWPSKYSVRIRRLSQESLSGMYLTGEAGSIEEVRENHTHCFLM